MAEARVSAEPDNAEAVARYKSVLRQVLDARPSGTRQRIASALGKNRSFVSQIANPSYSTPIPARHLDLIMEICHFSPAEKTAFLDAYAEAHPRRISLVEARPKVRPHTIFLPDFGDAERNNKVDVLIGDFVLKLIDLVAAPDDDDDDGFAKDGAAQKTPGRLTDEKTDQ